MITRYLYRNPRIAWLIVATIVVAGFACLSVMPRLEDPILKQRVAVITVSLQGAAPAEIESSVTVPIERWLNEFSEIKQVRSNTRANFTSIVVELKDRVDDPDTVWASVKRKLTDNENALPDNCSKPELRVFPLKAFAAILAIVPQLDVDAPFQHRRIVKRLRRKIETLEATESVSVFGDWGEEVTVKVSPQALTSMGVSPGAIAQQITESEPVPAGDTAQSTTQLMIELKEPDNLLRQIEDVLIQSSMSPEPIRLAEFATVEKTSPEPRSSAAIIDGKDSIVLGVMVDNDSRVDIWTDELEQVIREFDAEFSGMYSVVPLFKQSAQIQSRMFGLLRNLAISTSALAIIVLLMMGWRSMMVVAISLPLSACLVICGLRMLSIPIHQMSITGLIVALGLLIDNAIVIVEEVRMRIFEGKKPFAAMVDAVKHLRMPLLGSSLTTILAFVPIATMPGPSGEFVGSLAVSVILAIAASFLLAMTLIPPLVISMGVNEQQRGFFETGIRLDWIASLYRQSLALTFRFPIIGVLIGASLPVAGFYFAQQLEKQFFPASDRAQIQIELELPASETLASVRDTLDRVIPLVAADDEVNEQYWFLGQSAPTFYYNVVPRRLNSPNYAQAFIDIAPDAQLNVLVNRLQARLDSEVLNARVLVRKLEQGPPFDAPVEVRVFGDDLTQLERTGSQIRALVSRNVNVTHTRSDLGSTIPKLTLDLNEGLMRQTRLTPKAISRFLYVASEGVKAGTFFDQGEQVPVHVKIDYADQSVLEALSALQIDSPAQPRASSPQPGAMDRRPAGPDAAANRHLLGSLGEFELQSDVGTIIRIDGQRVNEIKAYLRAGALPSEVTDQIRNELNQSDIRLAGVDRIEFGGETEKRNQAISTLIANAVVLFSIMLLTLVTVLGSFRSAFIIASVGSLAIGLGPLALYSFDYPFGFMAIVGTMGLVGVAINDSIVVLAAIRANEKLDPSSPVVHGLHEESGKRKKLEDVVIGCTRHILTTTLTTTIGFLPLVIFGGKFWPPLAIVISAGVCGATLLALYFVPSVDLFLKARQRT